MKKEDQIIALLQEILLQVTRSANASKDGFYISYPSNFTGEYKVKNNIEENVK